MQQIETLLAKGEGETEAGAQESTDLSAIRAKLEASVAGDDAVKGHMENVQEMVQGVPESVRAAADAAGVEYRQYVTLLGDCIAQMDADLAAQQEVLAELSGVQEGAAGVNASALTELLEQLRTADQKRQELCDRLLAFEETQLAEQQKKLEELQKKLEEAHSGQTESEGSGVQSGQTEGEGSGVHSGQTESEGSGVHSGQTESESSGVHSGQTESEGSEMQSGQTESEGMPQTQEGEGETFPSGGGSTGSGAAAMGGGSAGSGAAAMGGGSAESGAAAMGSMTMEELKLTESDISLFGDTYDLSSFENLLEQEPSDDDGAQELLEQLEDAQTTVTKQYEELVRSRKATELKIQYTCDASVLAGRLAEITYEQELADWEETLQEAKDRKKELEDQKRVLDEMQDGVVSADQSGLLAEVGYEAEDVLGSDTPVVSYYDTSAVTVTVAVPQEEIAQMQVGDTAEVELSGRQRMTGTITEKASEVQDGTSRTTVNYEVTVSVENEDGRLSSGMSAAVTVEAEEDEHE